MEDELSELPEVRPCANPSCTEDVAFSIFGGAARSDSIKYRGACASGHRNVWAPEMSKQWLEDRTD